MHFTVRGQHTAWDEARPQAAENERGAGEVNSEKRPARLAVRHASHQATGLRPVTAPRYARTATREGVAAGADIL